MSKFVDKLHNLPKTSTSSIGFHSSAGESKSSAMLLIAGLSGMDPEEAGIIANSTVDAGLILNQKFDIKNVKQMVKVVGDTPLGIFLKDMSNDKVNELVDSGCDFVAFDMKTSAVALRGEEIGKFLMIEPSSDQGLVRAINGLDIDGVFINRGEEAFITVEHLLVCQRFSELVDKPLAITLLSSVTSVELSNLWRAGIDAIIIPPAQPTEVLTRLKKMIGNLPKEAKRRRSKIDVMLPHYSSDISEEDEEGEEI